MSDQKFDTIKSAVQQEGKKIQRINNRAHYAHMWLHLDPLDRGQGIQFARIASEERLPSNLVRAIESGVRRALQRDGQEGYPVTDLRCSIDGSFHPVDSRESDYDEVAFRTTIEALGRAGTRRVE